MKATAQLAVPTEAVLNVTLQMTVKDAQELLEQLKPTHVHYGPLETLHRATREAISIAFASHASEVNVENGRVKK